MAAGRPQAPSDYPVQLGKVQAPPLRDDTLARDRLLDWLSVKIHSRVVLLVAEAGYGKTTLLADFSRRTRIRVLWFRLDRGDRDWVGFIAHLVAALRIHQPAFGPATSALLRETATSTPSIDTVLDTFLRELNGLPDDPTAFVFDDVHLVDDAPDVRDVLRELTARAPDRMSFVFASRREPPVRLARLRALGEVAELGADDLRFDAAETERLFRETYQMPLEPSVLAELGRRTEGWAASLQLVRAALHDRNPAQVRTFIASLSGAEGHLYEYLAEEVIGELPEELQQFLMRTSLLDVVDLTLGPVAADLSVDETRTHIEEAERHGLLGRGAPSSRSHARAHPLVRDFLQARLLRAIGDDGVSQIHTRIAQAAESVDWQKAARHYHAADRDDDARRVLASSIERILAEGAYSAAQEMAGAMGSDLPGAVGLVLRSRIAQQHASKVEGLALAEEAHASDPNSTAVLLNLIAARMFADDVSGALAAIRELESTGAPLSEMGRSFEVVLEASVDGSVDLAVNELQALSSHLRGRGEDHFLGVSLLNLSSCYLAKGELGLALAAADESVAKLAASSGGIELISARLARASALAYLGNMELARTEMRDAYQAARQGQVIELATEIGRIEALLGSPEVAWPVIERVEDEILTESDLGDQARISRALLRLRDWDLVGAEHDVGAVKPRLVRSTPAFESIRLLTKGLIAALDGDPTAPATISSGVVSATAQGAHLWAAYGQLLYALTREGPDPSSEVVGVGGAMPWVVSMLAEVVASRLSALSPAALAIVHNEAERRPERWRSPTRRALSASDPSARRKAANLLAAIGEIGDVLLLRERGRRARDAGTTRFALELARRLADRVFVEDLGRVEFHIGRRVVQGVDVRRKVLALLCLLLSKSRFSATREEVVDSLWPDHDPAAALNSLNQTVYFLRRLFEANYDDETSPGYVGQDGETVWLDPELVDSRSRRCMDLVRRSGADTDADLSVELAREYRGRFALDFSYEEWSSSYRDSLHAGYLRVMEHAIRSDLDSGHFGRGTFLGERAAEVDPESEHIQVALVRLYRLSGAHAAAAEQYEHYARVMQDLGVEPADISEV
jgi:DNA-binding SARP family transcriptional activator